MNRWAIVWLVSAGLFLGFGASATTVGVGVGIDPTGIVMFSALTETAISDSFDLRAQAGVATNQVAGLMLATADLLYHLPVPPVDPFVGIGAGAALTPPPFSTGVVVEGLVGVRVLPLQLVTFFAQVRYLARWSGAGLTTGPIFEAGVQLRF